MNVVIPVFPRVVVTDNQFREKRVNNKKAQLSFVQDGDKGFAQELANHVDKNDSDTDGVFVATRVISVAKILSAKDVAKNVSVAIFIAEKPGGAQWTKVLACAKSMHRLVFSLFVVDVACGVMVGVPADNRVKPVLICQHGGVQK